MMFSVSSLLLLTVLQCIAAQWRGAQFHVIREWRYINFTWPSDESYMTAIRNQYYIPEHNVIAGLKYYDGFYYLTLPRMKNGVPATLARISAIDTIDTAPLLQPYPSWEMNREDDCNALQNVQNIEIDAKGQLWIIDGGHTSTLLERPTEKCPPKLVIYDIKGNRSTTVYTFPENVANKQASFLYDLVVDSTDGGYAYITDNSGRDPGIIVYSLRDNRSWKFRHSRSMRADPTATDFRITGITVSAPINIAGIALGPKVQTSNSQVVIGEDREVFYSPLSSHHLYSINTSVLKNEANTNNGQEFMGQVRDLGTKASQTASMIMDYQGVLYYGLLSDNSIGRWDSHTPFQTGQKIISRDPEYLQWPSSFAFDDMGNLTLMTNKLQKFIYDKIYLDQPNFRLLSANVQSKSYIYDNNFEYRPATMNYPGSGWESSPRSDFGSGSSLYPSPSPYTPSPSPYTPPQSGFPSSTPYNPSTSQGYSPLYDNEIGHSGTGHASASFLGAALAAVFFVLIR